MNLDNVDYAFFPFLEESKQFYREQYSLPDIFTEQALDIAVKRIKTSVLEDKKRSTTYSSELQFKSYICAKALLTEMNNPVYTYEFFESEASYLVNNYSIEDLMNIINVSVTPINPISPDTLVQSELSKNILQFDSELVERYTERFYTDIDPVGLLLQGSDPKSIFKGMFMKSRADPRLYKVNSSEVVTSDRIQLQKSRVQDSEIYMSKTTIREYLIEELMKRLSEKYPNPVSDVTIKGESLDEILQEKIEFCIAQLPKISYGSYDSIQVSNLPDQLQSVYMRIRSDPNLVTEEEYRLLFHTLYRLGFTKSTIIDIFTFETDLGENYLTDLLSDSSVTRTDEIETWSDIDEIVSSNKTEEDVYKSVTRTPVEYYRLCSYLNS